MHAITAEQAATVESAICRCGKLSDSHQISAADDDDDGICLAADVCGRRHYDAAVTTTKCSQC